MVGCNFRNDEVLQFVEYSYLTNSQITIDTISSSTIPPTNQVLDQLTLAIKIEHPVVFDFKS